jgi:general nucleoside transport system permease protein
MPTLTRDMVVVIQGLIILVCGALEHVLRSPVEALLRS